MNGFTNLLQTPCTHNLYHDEVADRGYSMDFTPWTQNDIRCDLKNKKMQDFEFLQLSKRSVLEKKQQISGNIWPMVKAWLKQLG